MPHVQDNMGSTNNNKDLHICIAGAGMGGLTCALALAKAGFNHIDVYETASNLGFVGAGIQLAPNMARILDRLGCWDPIAADAVILKSAQVRQGSTDETMADVSMAYVGDTYGYPHMVGHRSNLAGSIADACKKEKAVDFFFATSLSAVKTFSPKVKFTATPRKGEPYEVECDVLLGADGVKSEVRLQMLSELGINAKVQDSGQAAYRIMLKREDMEHDPELLELVDTERITRWIGHKRHIIAYPVSSKQIYNLSTAQPDTNFAAAPDETYTTKGSKVEMLKVYEDFCPKIQKMLNMVPDGEVCEWKLRVHSPLPTWVHGSMALVGDACHPTLPHMAQGASQAIEDAAVLGVVLARMPDTKPESVNKALLVYEKVRKERAEALVEMAAANGRDMHLGDGAAKEARDKAFAALKAGKQGKVPDKTADPDAQRIVYSVDVWKDAEDQFDEIYNSL